ncbi:MAG: hypothetical protein V1726_02205 [Methanobacteriota archaeon]
MKKIVVVGGSIGAVIILLMMVFPTVGNAQTIKTNVISEIFFEKLKSLNLGDYPGYWLETLIFILIRLFVWFYANIWLNLGGS